jgi:rubrerythrin
MELGTFGAVMAFALQVVSQSAEFYETVCDRAKGPRLKEVLKALQDGANRDRATMEQTRRENVTEMILEPIAGLRQEDYMATVDESILGSDTAIVKTALLLEGRDQRFFEVSAAKLPLPEVARLFRKVAKRREENLAKLRALTE